MRNLEFELVYLTLLTKEGLKPLSRWEGDFKDKELSFIRDMGLRTGIVERSLKTGERIEELIFSKDKSLIEIYTKRFIKTPLKKTPEIMRFEGRLFGYPECCVEYFIKEGYAENGLAPEDQRILFWWVCPECRITPLLLPKYKRIHKKAKRLYAKLGYNQKFSLKRIAIGVSLLSSIALATTALDISPIPAQLKDPHRLNIPNDRDKDFLDDSIEHLFNLDPNNPDTNHNGILDGVELSRRMWVIIKHLPTSKQSDRPYRVEHTAYGIERCEICGEEMNMGRVEIINPVKGISISFPYMGLHYMRHGSFKYQGSDNKGIVDAGLLGKVLEMIE